ncbi:hypothetical protein C1645_839690 [Glomus cerebriforme]|uniref:Uncharacterized protein n=1 Tax=Glomus cerebriforme TaxID=658196 RepID=A0A397SC03_9GLOM|nr:hypothetical protein C1645_839690 [Glomus cerebriforme]
MSASNQEINWKNIYDYGDNIEFLNKDEDINMLSLDDDNLSSTATNLESIMTEDISYDTEILLYDELALKKMQKLLKIYDNEINEDIDFNFDELTILEMESTKSKLTKKEEIDYLVKNNSDSLTSCVIIDIIDNELKCCSKTAACPLIQLIGIWEIEVDEKVFTSKKKENKLHTLGVCSSHFNFDQNKLHTTNLKQMRPVDKIPCLRLKACPVFRDIDNLDDSIIKKSNSKYRSYENQKRQLLIKLYPILSIFNTNANTSTSTSQTAQIELEENLLSLFLIKTALYLEKVDLKTLDKSNDFTSKTSKATGEMLGNIIWKSQKEVRKKKQGLENPNSLNNYRQSFPSSLINFFDEMIITLEKKKHEVINRKRKQRNLELKSFDTFHAEKKLTFLASVILTIAFPEVNIWFTYILSSLCQKPKLLSSLYAIFYTANILSHTQSYERKLEKIRMKESQSEKKLIQGDNIWNISVINNIDFKEQTFSYGNIFDSTHKSSYATLQMVFQFALPEPLNNIIDNNNNNNNGLLLFGESQYTKNLLKIYEDIFANLLQISNDWDINDIYDKIAEKIPIGCQVPSPNVVILEPGKSPNCDENVHDACNMYFNDVGLSNNNYLDIAYNEAIFRRLITYREKKDNIRLILGQWHISTLVKN